MSEGQNPTVRRAGAGDAETIGRMLDAFNREYDEPTPGPAAIAERFRGPLAEDGTVVLLGSVEGGAGAGPGPKAGSGSGPHGIAVLRFREAIWSAALECYLAELHVTPARRRRGLGRKLMETAIEIARESGADYMDLGTSEDDGAARALYESLGFRNRESREDGPIMYVYEREL